MTIYKKTVISIGCGYSQRNLLLACHKMGYYIMGIDRNPIDFVDMEKIEVSTHDSDLAIEHLQEKVNFEYLGLVCQSSGIALRTAERISCRYNLKRVGDLITECSISKYRLYNEMKKRGIPTIKSLITEDWGTCSTNIGMVIKPDISQFGKTNVGIIEDSESAKAIYKRAYDESLNNKVLIQEYIHGKDIGICLACLNGSIVWHCFFSEINSFKNCQLIHKTLVIGKRQVSTEFEDIMVKVSSKIVREYHTSGFIFITFRVNNEYGPLVYEINPGLCGDRLAEEILPTQYANHDFYKTEIQLKLGQYPELPRKNI